MSQQITQAVNADSYKSIKAVINKKSILCGMEHICQRYGKIMPRMPSKSSLHPVEKAGWALGCVTPGDKRQSGEHCFAHPLKFCIAFRSLSLVQSSNVGAFGGNTPCKSKSFMHFVPERTSMVAQKTVSSKPGLCPTETIKPVCGARRLWFCPWCCKVWNRSLLMVVGL